MMRILLSCWLITQSSAFVVPTWPVSRPAPIVLLHANSQDRCDVACFGGGFGGLYTALAVKRKDPSLDVVLVEPTESFVFLPLLYDLCVGTASEAEVCPTYNSILANTGIRQVYGTLENLQDRSATLKPCNNKAPHKLKFSAAVVAVGASPDSILARVPGATELAQPFYTSPDAKQTRRLLNRLSETESPKIAVVGGGFGGVELAASVSRKLKNAQVQLLSKGPPMAGTRAEKLVQQALAKLGVVVIDCAVKELSKQDDDGDDDKIVVQQEIPISDDASLSTEKAIIQDTYDAVLWTAGSRPADPIPGGCPNLRTSPSGRLAVDVTLQCQSASSTDPYIWALGDCAEVLDEKGVPLSPAPPKTAQCAMQQADVVSDNLIKQLNANYNTDVTGRKFVFQEAGNLLTLGGPNGAILAPKTGPLAPIFEPLLDSANSLLSVADTVIEKILENEKVQELGVESLGLSLGSYGIGVTEEVTGTFAGTVSGAARRAIYAIAMPTNKQSVVSFASAAITTAASLAREANEARRKKAKK